MPEISPAEKLFTENVDRLVSGREVRELPADDRDLQSALDFARLIKYRQPQPSPRFQAALKARLLQSLAEQEEVRPTWFQRLVTRLTPVQPVWQAVAVIALVLVIGGAVLAIILGNQSTGPVTRAPTPALTVPATTTTAAATTVAAATTTATTTAAAGAEVRPAATPPADWAGIESVRLSAAASTDRAVYGPGEPVLIEVTLKNNGTQPLALVQFPPILSLMSELGQPVLTFKAGPQSLTLAPGESAVFSQVWDQQDARANSVAAGRYYLELEDIDFYGQSYSLDLDQPVSFEIIY